MQVKLHHIFIMLLLSTICAACSNDDVKPDTEKPTAQIELENSIATFSPGTAIIINATFTDNVELDRCEVTIESLHNLKSAKPDWNYDSDEITLSGKTQTIENLQILPIIPVDINLGEYRLFFKVIDTAGNANIYELDIVIK